ncbi:MAG: Ig-like domain repeat protein, partial [Terracidiphilus sp.]
TSLGTGTLSAGVATLTTSFATAGSYSLTAVYGGSATYATSTSSAVTVTVSAGTKTATTTALAASTTTPTAGASVTLTATVAPSAATGTVTFYSGTTSLGTGTLSAGVATLTTSFATAGSYSLTAVYGGSTTYATSTSSAVSINVSSGSGSATACKVVYSITPQGSDSFGASVDIYNTGTSAWTSWTLTWTWANGQTIASLWNGIESQSGANVTVNSEGYNGAIAAGASYGSLGFNGTWNGITNAPPANFAINGTTCVGSGSGFTMAPSVSPLTINQGSSSTDTLTITDFGGFAGSVNLTATGLPTGITAAFGTNPTTGSSVITFTAAAAVPAASATVTITGTSGSTTATSTIGLNVNGTTAISVNQTGKGPTVTDQLLGMNMPAWYDIVTNQTAIVDAFQTAGIKAVRWPGGSWSDVYHWETNTNCQNAPYGGGTPDADDIFANFVSDLAIPAGLDVALTADYGTNPTCTGGGLPSEAAAWAAAALTDGITVSHMTVGNEVYGATWEEDLHTPANNPATYAAAVAGSSGYYEAIKAASPKTLVGVVVDADNTVGGWDNTVLANAKGSYDFVEYHYYPEAPGFENDTTLIHQDAQQLTTNLNTIKSELAEWGTPDTPIYVGEMGATYSSPGKQSMSITQALFAGQELGEMMNDGVSRATWWIGFGGCADSTYGGNFSSSLYGWQSFGGYMVFSDGLTDYYECTAETLAPGVLLPTARAFQLFSNVAVTGESVLTASVTGDTADVVAYAATHSGGTALVLFNRNETTSEAVSVTLSAQTKATSVTVETYDKAIYDLSGSPTGTIPDPAGTNTWAPPTTTTITSPTLPLALTLAPWSMNVVIIQ